MRIHASFRSGIMLSALASIVAPAAANGVCGYPWGYTTPPTLHYWGPPWF